ncbi:MBL fold metallo-hydrolase [Pedobacter ginsenosidimutans]|uniref:MBL fold metallo-hydrolase n=1 Tax=Pedobacter ginsenosidimutans TaxID=687842 RepID=A0A0T5VIK2_9SPHI|nr:MBL fold metallo-hydrolase [Pedobacter ginsenosidimutans]KRT13396.1 MBL fold metallo-hydrolase [Pedobacter ginsenosidimutans]
MKKLLVTAVLSLTAIASFGQKVSGSKSSLQLVRNATLIIHYGGHKILVDPMLSAKGAIESWAGIARNPTVDIRMPMQQITDNVDLVLVSHTHADHFDDAANNILKKSIKIINQPADKVFFSSKGYINAETLENQTKWDNISIERINGEHGSGKVLEMMGKTSGFVLSAKNEPTIYIMGDAIWTDRIKENIKRIKPDIIVVNSGGAQIKGFENVPIIMDEKQVMQLISASGKAKIIAVHMDALDHCRTTRLTLSEEAKKNSVGENKLVILKDTEIFTLGK